MAATMFERVYSRGTTVAQDGASVEKQLMVYGSDDDAEVRSLVETFLATNMTYGGGAYQEYKINTLGGGIWEVIVTYSPQLSRRAGDLIYSFEVSGATTHITKSLATVTKKPASAPDTKGAIGVSKDGVEGCDVQTPVFHFTLTAYLADDDVDATLKRAIAGLVGHTNDGVFREYEAGEVLFLGATGSQRSVNDWEITYRFAASLNATGLTFLDQTYDKGGWEYVWVSFEDDLASSTKLLKVPKFLYVERVYPAGDFAGLGIGV